MYEIIKKEILAPKILLMEIKAPRVAKYCEPGQFVIVRLDEYAERIPLTICDFNRQKETITIVFQAVGLSTEKMLKLKTGDTFKDVAGPLGCPSAFITKDITSLKQKKFLFVAGGVGAAPVYPQVKWLYQQNIKTDVIIGARNAEMLILEKEMREISKNLYLATDDGSLGHHGLVTDLIKKVVTETDEKYDECIVIGPMIMMKFVSHLTKELAIPTTVSMNAIMVDATGMCGACRLSVDKEVKFACVDGPEFDGHLIDFDEAITRQTLYKKNEQQAMQELNHQSGCCGGRK